MTETWLWLSSDAFLFFAVQGALALFVALAASLDLVHRLRAGSGAAVLRVTRSERSMAALYGVYGTVSAVLVGLSLTVDVAVRYRVFWTIVDVLQAAYLCVWNAWFRNKLIGWASQISTLETR
jgi:hypothetical protein